MEVTRNGRMRLPRANLEQKIMILNHFHNSKRPQSETVEFFRDRYSISSSSLSEWLKNEQELRERYNLANRVDSLTGQVMKQNKRKSRFKYDRINKAMYEFVQKKLAANEPLSEPVLRMYWSELAHKYGVDDPKRLESFSHGWLTTFKKRHGLDRQLEGIRGAGGGASTPSSERLAQLEVVETADKVGMHDGFTGTAGGAEAPDYGLTSIDHTASGQTDRYSPYEMSQLLNQDANPISRRFTRPEHGAQPQGQSQPPPTTQQTAQQGGQPPQPRPQQESANAFHHMNPMNSFLPLENQVNRLQPQPQPVSQDAIGVNDMERLVYIWGEKFFQQHGLNFPKSKEIFDQFKSKFFEERLAWQQRTSGGTSTVDEFFIRRR